MKKLFQRLLRWWRGNPVTYNEFRGYLVDMAGLNSMEEVVDRALTEEVFKKHHTIYPPSMPHHGAITGEFTKKHE